MVARKLHDDDDDDDDNGSGDRFQPGIGVDAKGGGVIDPTKNVGDLVKAEAKKRDELRAADKELLDFKVVALKDYQDGMRVAGERFRDFARDAQEKYQNAAREADSKRMDQLAELRQVYETRIADMLSASVPSTSSLVSTQLVQIQATFDARVSKLEQFRWESGGRSSVTDPAIGDAISKMSSTIAAMNARLDRGEGTTVATKEVHTDNRSLVNTVIAAAVAIVVVMTGLGAFVSFSNRTPPAAFQNGQR